MLEGRIIKALSGFYYVQSNDIVYTCRGRGLFRNQNISPLVGDFVKFDITEGHAGYIQEIGDRTNELIRPPVANITQAIIVNAAVEPNFSTLLLDRFLVVVESLGISPLIVITKKDLATEANIADINVFVADYEAIGYKVRFLSLDQPQELNRVKEYLADHVTVVMGQSGVGKSTLLNVIDPAFAIKTAAISKSLGRGKHTTRHVELLEVNGGLVADTPGFSSLEFTGIEAEELSHYFIEIGRASKNCKFRMCSHDQEPGCAVKAEVEAGKIQNYRYKHYLAFLLEIQNRKPRY